NLGGGLLASAGSNDIFIAKYNSSGAYLWGRRFGDASDQFAQSVTTDPSGNVILTGYFFGTVDFGGGPLASAGSADIYVAKFDPNGNPRWSKRYGNASAQFGNSVTTDASGNILLTGQFFGTVTFGGSTLFSAGFADIFLAKLDVNGGHLWSKRYGDSTDQRG